MKIEEDLGLIKKHLEEKKDFILIYDGEDFGTYSYNEASKRYEGKIGYIDLKSMLKAIIDDAYFIKLKIK